MFEQYKLTLGNNRAHWGFLVVAVVVAAQMLKFWFSARTEDTLVQLAQIYKVQPLQKYQ